MATEYEHKMVHGEKGQRMTMLTGKHREAKTKALKRLKVGIEHKYKKLRSGKSKQQQHDEAMSGDYK